MVLEAFNFKYDELQFIKQNAFDLRSGLFVELSFLMVRAPFPSLSIRFWWVFLFLAWLFEVGFVPSLTF
jgi:hypothetical protein